MSGLGSALNGVVRVRAKPAGNVCFLYLQSAPLQTLCIQTD